MDKFSGQKSATQYLYAPIDPFAHQMLAKGMPKEVLQTFLGHRSIRTTEIYANWVNKVELIKWL